MQIGSRHTRVRARESENEERAALWRRFVEVDDAFEEYERRTTRRPPVVVLEGAG